MFEDVNAYMAKSRDERTSHLTLEESCIEIGGIHKEYRGMLAHFLRTTIPRGRWIQLCHACNNSKCSNPKHLYWGTPKENYDDSVADGKRTKSFARLTKEKLGDQEFEALQKRRSSLGGKSKTRRRIAGVEEKEQEHLAYLGSITDRRRGWIGKASDHLGISHTQVRRLLNKGS